MKRRNWSWRRALAVLVSVGLLGVLVAVPAQAQTRRPLLLIGGTFATAEGLDAVAKPWFVDQPGYNNENVYTMGLEREQWWSPVAEFILDLFALGYGFPPEHVSGDGTASIDEDEEFGDPSSVDKITRKVDEILARHPEADQVDIIGHSQGGVAARWYVKAGGVDKVHTLISLGAPQRGVPVSTLTEYYLWDFACDVGSFPGYADVCYDMLVYPGQLPEFIRKLNHTGDPTPGNVRYFHLYVPDDIDDSFTDLGFVSERIPDEAAEHEREWEHPVLRERMLARLS